MTTNDAMNRTLRAAAGRHSFTGLDEELSAGGRWLRAKVDEARRRGTAVAEAELPADPPPPKKDHGSADGGAGMNVPPTPPSMNALIRNEYDPSEDIRRRGR